MQMSNKKIVYKGKIFTITHETIIDKYDIAHVVEKCSRPDVVTIMALTKNYEVLFINEFRPGNASNMLWLPGGRIENDETPDQTARRELEEETGNEASNIFLYHKKSPSDSFTNNGYVFLANGLTEIGKKRGDEKGNVRVEKIQLERAVKHALEGKIANEFFAFLILKLDYDIRHNHIKAI